MPGLHAAVGEKFAARVHTQGRTIQLTISWAEKILSGLSTGVLGRDKATCREILILHPQSDTNGGPMGADSLETALGLHVTACTAFSPERFRCSVTSVTKSVCARGGRGKRGADSKLTGDHACIAFARKFCSRC